MVRVQVQFSEGQLRSLRRKAQQSGVSVAEMVRRFVETGLASGQADLDARYERAMAFVGSMQDPEGATDLAENHDEYLAAAFR
jgi:hypothetical protein